MNLVRRTRGANREFVQILRCDPCSYCGDLEPPATIDHIVPKSVGGLNVWENMTAACHRCNNAKANEPLLGFLLRRFACAA